MYKRKGTQGEKIESVTFSEIRREYMNRQLTDTDKGGGWG